mmetsp:Transcript_8899/g.22661  ORF Transcript_8899/g.22661 Transcript_8899/m.22661 type:complete len:85 (-) Transcript_8899:44-298(-)
MYRADDFPWEAVLHASRTAARWRFVKLTKSSYARKRKSNGPVTPQGRPSESSSSLGRGQEGEEGRILIEDRSSGSKLPAHRVRP